MALFDEIYIKRKQIIKESVEKVLLDFSESLPKIYRDLFYGSYDIDPKNLVVWYIFEKDSDLNNAKASGLCERIKSATINNLVSLGYPESAFKMSNSVDYEITSNDTVEKSDKGVTNSENNIDDNEKKFALICFTTHEDIIREAGGDYHCYFQ